MQERPNLYLSQAANKLPDAVNWDMFEGLLEPPSDGIFATSAKIHFSALLLALWFKLSGAFKIQSSFPPLLFEDVCVRMTSSSA